MSERKSFAVTSRLTAPAAILYVANSSQIGGGNRSLMDLIAGLDRSRFRPVLVAPTQGPLVEWASSTGVTYRIVPPGDWDGRIGLTWRTSRLVGSIVNVRARIVHAIAPTCYRAAALAAWLTGARRICHLGYPPESGELAWSFTIPPNVVIACHEGQARELRERVQSIAPAARLVAVPNGIDTQRFSASPACQAPASDVGRPRVLIVGHLSEVKGYPTFLQAAARLVASAVDCNFVALGGETACPGYRQVLENQVTNLGLTDRMRFLGWRSDVDVVLRSADVVVMPSLAEGLPMALLEAMACARPIIATPVGGIPEAIIDEVTGLLVPPGDAGALAGAIARILRDPSLARRLGERARASAVANFSVARLVSEVESIYGSLLTGRGVARLREVTSRS